MLHVELENILSEADATTQIGTLISKVDGSDQIIVITRDNRPAVALIAVSQLEGLTGRQVRPAAPLAAPAAAPVVPPEAAPAMDTSFGSSMPAAAPALPSLPDFPGDAVVDETPAMPAPQAASQPGLTSFTPGVASMPTMPVPPQVPTMPVPPSIPAMPEAAVPGAVPPPAPAPTMEAPAGLPDFAKHQESGLPPEDLSSSSPLA